MAHLATQTITVDGLNPTFAAAGASGDTFRATARTFVEIINGSGAPRFFVITSKTDSWGAAGTLVVTIPAGERRRIRVADPDRFNIGAGGLAAIGYSDTASITVAVFEL